MDNRIDPIPDGWQFWIDRGGTFTDVVARDPQGALHVRKLLSENPEQYADAPIHAIHSLLDVAPDERRPTERIGAVKMGTTLATNALLERKGMAVGLVATKGFGDLLEIGYQDRPDLFALEIRKPESLAAAIVEVGERVLADGTVRRRPDRDEVCKALLSLRSQGIDNVAVLFLHSFAYPGHELLVEEVAEELGFGHVSLSHRVAREIRAVPRGDTTLADAYLTPIIRAYVRRAQEHIGESSPLHFMQSNGGLARGERFSGKDAILSGPAGGVVAYRHTCARAGFPKAVGFDMGGTSTDVSRVDGEPEYTYEKVVAGIRLKAPMIHIETVAAGGGSILAFDGRRMTVGPESAGANPGPACYRRGGPASVTDANLVLGRIVPEHFPRCFGPEANEPLDAGAARERLAALTERISLAAPHPLSVEQVAAGFVRIANENMAKPIKDISVARGYNIREYALACFGGAGPQHACAIASSLGIATILLHPLSGVLSAYGMGIADIVHEDVEAVLTPLNAENLSALGARFAAIESEGCGVMQAERVPAGQRLFRRSADLRYQGVDTALTVAVSGPGSEGAPLPTVSALRETFECQHQQLYGFTKPGHPVEVVNIRVRTTGRASGSDAVEAPSDTPQAENQDASFKAFGAVKVHFDVVAPDGTRQTAPMETPLYRRAALEPGDALAGPAMVIEDASTVVVDPGWSARVDERRNLVLTCGQTHDSTGRVGAERDPIMLEIFNNLFMSVADQMGKTLERVSHSVNMKERLDFSCAVFTAEGELVANAHHIPVHLGAMNESVRAVLKERGDAMAPGDVYVTNDPYHGGSHLPDVTVVTPVFDNRGDRIFFVASRGHHADIGGVTPGSMPPESHTLSEEGVVLKNALLISGGRFLENEIRVLLGAGPYPARNIPERLSDLRAQIAANQKGVELLLLMCGKYSLETVRAYMGHVRENASESMREVLTALPDGVHRFEDRMDDGTPVVCSVTVSGSEAAVDFTGTGPQSRGNLNAPPAVAIAAVLYVFRTLVMRPVPLNGGCLEPITVKLPEGSLLSPQFPAAVAGGNVETSMRVVDALYGALGALAAGQGTMNNLSFGDGGWGYYETICGGAGAGEGFQGASAVHTHMTNTRITDPEVLERRYPVVLRQFSIRRGSGGRGRWRGGDGVVRTIEFLEPVSVTMLSERRVTAPYGMAGGAPGQPGRNVLVRGAEERVLPGRFAVDAQPGDVIVIETPGGGGYGAES